MTRLHERSLEVAATNEGARWILTSPAPGWFFPRIRHGDLVVHGSVIGDLDVLGRRTRLVAPDVHGVAQPDQLAPRAVGYGDPLIVLDRGAQLAPTAGAARGGADRAQDSTALVFRAPTSGRFYGRPSPDKAAFVSSGDEVTVGTTICLLEVMKTFHRVTYGGAGLPARAKVRAILVADGADVTQGEPLLALE